MKIVYRRAALADIAQIHAYIAPHNPVAAKGVVHRIRATAALLAEMPHAGLATNKSGLYKIIVPHLPYIIYYRIVEPVIDIVAVFDARQETPPDQA